MTLQCLNLECKFQPNAWAEYKWGAAHIISLCVEIPGRTRQLQQKGLAFGVQWVLTFQQRRGEAQRSAALSAASAKWAFPRWILFSPEVILCSHVDCADVYWGCRLAAAAAYPLSADYCSRYRLHQKVTLVRLFSLSLFFKDENIFWSLRSSGLQLVEVERSRCVCY